jgi:hypothetical protein
MSRTRLQRHVRLGEIRAGILLVFIQKKFVQPPRQVVVMRYVPLGSGRRIILMDTANERTKRLCESRLRNARPIGHVVEDKGDDIAD